MIDKLKKEYIRFRDNLIFRLAFKPGSQREIIAAFHKLYYDSGIHEKTWRSVAWLGARVGKSPFDLWLYQELIYRLKPDLIIETGTYWGGSAYYFATLCELIGKGQVVSIDIEDAEIPVAREGFRPEKLRPPHPRIQYWQGSSIDPQIVKRVQALASDAKTVLVSLDSDHRKPHVLQELQIYSRIVTSGSYIVVEDTNVNGHPVYPDFGPGPWEAVDEFLKSTSEFDVDEELASTHLMTLHPRGFLRKKS